MKYLSTSIAQTVFQACMDYPINATGQRNYSPELEAVRTSFASGRITRQSPGKLSEAVSRFVYIQTDRDRALFGPASNQINSPRTGSTRITTIQITLIPVVALLCMTLTIAQISAISISKPNNPPTSIPMNASC